MAKKKNKNIISGYWKDDAYQSPEMMMREAFLRTAQETLDSFGVESYGIDQVRGALLMLEKFINIRDEQ